MNEETERAGTKDKRETFSALEYFLLSIMVYFRSQSQTKRTSPSMQPNPFMIYLIHAKTCFNSYTKPLHGLRHLLL